jgi:hypothetical protein
MIVLQEAAALAVAFSPAIEKFRNCFSSGIGLKLTRQVSNTEIVV